MAIPIKELKGLIESGEPKEEVAIPTRIITLGKVLQCLEKLSRRDCLWVLRRAIRELGGK